jgi:predicted amidohydrolase
MTTIGVALLQLRSPGLDPERAQRDGEAACRKAAAMGAHIALFPEMWQIGYGLSTTGDVPLAMQLELAADPRGAFVRHFEALASELNMAIVLTYLERSAHGPRNTATLIDSQGAPVLTYAKVHTCDFNVEGVLTPGDAFPTAVLNTRDGNVCVGIMICHDREFPEAARELMLASILR